jgi:hypothetical protein
MRGGVEQSDLLLQTRRRSNSPLLNTKAMVDRSSNIDVKQEEWGPDGGRDEEGKDASMENLSGVCMTKPNNSDKIFHLFF